MSGTDGTPSDVYCGRVKWFNNKAGYGFITIVSGTDASLVEKDIFVHHSAISVKDEQQYRYLIQGEYVEFSLISVESEKYDWQATNVCGLKGGKLLCETRNESRNITSKPSRKRTRNTKSSTTESETSNMEVST